MRQRRYDRELEEFVAELLGGRVVQGSGNGKFAKMDARGSGILVSCKSTKHESFSLTKSDLAEVHEAARGHFGTGDVPAVAVEVDALGDPEVLLVLWPSDFVDLMASEQTIELTKQAARRKALLTPSGLRGD